MRVGLCLALAATAGPSAGAVAQSGGPPGAAPQLKYFRSDFGVAKAGCGPLPDKLDEPGSLLWRSPLDSGQSSPLVCSAKVFLTTYRREPKELAVVALDAATGAPLWKKVVAASAIETFHPQMGNAAVSTPACDGSRLYVFFGSYGLICYDLNGEVRWEHRLGPFRDEYGAGSSPMLIDDKVVLCEDHDTGSFLLAVDGLTGRTVWQVARPDAVRSYSTPALWTHQGHRELLVAGSLELAGYDPADGTLLWWSTWARAHRNPGAYTVRRGYLYGLVGARGRPGQPPRAGSLARGPGQVGQEQGRPAVAG